MAHGQNANKNHRDLWGKRPGSGFAPHCFDAKRHCRRVERRQWKPDSVLDQLERDAELDRAEEAEKYEDLCFDLEWGYPWEE